MMKLASMTIVTMLMTMTFVGLLPTTTAINDPNNTGGSVNVNGDWTVVDTRTYDSSTEIYMLNGNVVVKNGGRLTLDHAGLNFNSNAGVTRGIFVENGGYLEMKNNAYIRSNNMPFTYYMGLMSGSTIKLDGSYIGWAGGNIPNMMSSGIYLGADDAIITNMFIESPPANEIIYVDATNVTVGKSTIQINNNYGLYLNVSAELAMDNTTLLPTSPGLTGVYVDRDATLTMETSNVEHMSTGVEIWGGYAKIQACSIRNDSSYGIVVRGAGSAELIDNIIVDNDFGLYVEEFAQVTLTGSNRIYENYVGIFVGIGGSVNSTGTYVARDDYYNIQVEQGDIEFVGGNIVEKGWSTGVYLDYGADAIFRKTNFKSNGAPQFEVTGGSSATIINCNFVGGAFAAVVATRESYVDMRNSDFSMYGFMAFAIAGGIIHSTNNTFNDWGSYAFYADSASEITSTNDIGKNQMGGNGVGMANWMSRLIIRNGQFTFSSSPNLIGGSMENSEFLIYDSSFLMMSGYAQYLYVGNSYALAINSGIDPTIVEVYGDSRVDIGWHVDVKTVWQNNAAAPNASVEFKDNKGDVIHQLTMDQNGLGRLDAFQFTILDNNQVINHNGYNVTGTLNGMSGLTRINIKDNIPKNKPLLIPIIDTDAPVINITSPQDGLITNAHTIDIEGSVIENGSGIALIEAKVGTGAWKPVDGTGPLFLMEDYGLDLSGDEMDAIIRVTDKSGKSSESNVTITVDWTAPVIAVTQPVGLFVTTGEFDLNGTTDPTATLKVDGVVVSVAADGKFTISLDKADGTYNISLEATDLAGNVGTANKLVIVDTKAPTLTCDIANGTYVNTTSVVLKGSSNGTVVKAVIGQVNSSLDVIQGGWAITATLKEGANEIVLEAKDLAGLTTTLKLTINVDLKVPIITVSSPTGTVKTNAANYTITGKVQYTTGLSMNGNAVNFDANGNFSTTVTLAEGTNTFTIAAEKKGTCFPADSFFDIFLEKETRPPVVEITSPKNGLVTSSASVQVTGKVDDVAAKIKFGTSNLTNTNGTFTTTAALTVGANTITITATDVFGNTGTATITVTYDNICDFARTKPMKSKVTSTKDSVTITGTSEPGAKIYINDVAIPTNADGSFSYKLILKEGKNTINMKAVDPAGNEKSDAFSVTYTDARQFEMGALLGLGIVLMILGLIIGVVIGRVMSKPKAPPVEEEEEVVKAPSKTKPEPEEKKPEEEEEKPFTPEEEPEEEPAPVEKGSLKDKQKDSEVKPTESETKPAPKVTKPEPKPEPRPAAQTQSKKDDGSLEELLKGLEKKKGK